MEKYGKINEQDIPIMPVGHVDKKIGRFLVRVVKSPDLQIQIFPEDYDLLVEYNLLPKIVQKIENTLSHSDIKGEFSISLVPMMKSIYILSEDYFNKVIGGFKPMFEALEETLLTISAEAEEHR